MTAKKSPKPGKRTAPLKPDSVTAGETETASPTRKSYLPSFPIVGIGASAGGLEAVTQLLQALPADTGMGFVLVQHLSPERASMLPEILGRATKMPVAQVQGEPVVQPNHVYVIPPGRDMCVTHGVLELVPRSQARGPHHPIDQFMRSLAEDQAHFAIGVILSGTANDGTLGLEDIKAEGGLTFAQDHTARQESMPRSAVATGCVDFVLPPDGIAQELTRIAQHPLTAPVPTDENSGSADGRQLGRIVQRLGSATGVDFARYKTSTLGRRVFRRMALHKVLTLKDYEALLRSDPKELDALYEDVLIHVTRFFRDPEVFEALQADVLPRLFQNRTPQEPLRVWVLGCSSGEEAYSLAILCAEMADAHGSRVPVQVFASDLSTRMIEKARLGVYPQSIAQDVSPARLQRFFTVENGGYRVSRSIRDTCVFAPHNVLADPPFSRMDLVSCRNLLIYLEPALQQQVLPLLHYALKPGGLLVLGKSETTGASRELFQEEDSLHRIYSRKAGSTARIAGTQFLAAPRPDQPAPAAGPGNGRVPGGRVDVQREADRILAARYAPPAVLIDTNLEILQFWGDTSPYLTPLPGKATLNILRMARPGLLVALRAAIQKVRTQPSPVRQEGLHARSEGGIREVSLEVSRVPKAAETATGFLVTFEEVTPDLRRPAPLSSGQPAGEEVRCEILERENLRISQELEGTRDYLQAMIEQEQTINEELQSAGEEGQSANEELQSINEELETSKEEIQATNEELTTVNDELQARNEELHRISNDWHNLLQSVEVPLIIVGRELRIRRFSPRASDVLHLISGDVGRPLSDVNLSLSIDLEPLVEEVIESQASLEREIQRHGRWYLLRIRPYRTLDQVVDGAVLVFIDVDTLKRARQYAEEIVATVPNPLLVLDQNLRVRTANRAYRECFPSHLSAPEAADEPEGRLLFEVGDGQWDLPELRRLLHEVLHQGTSFDDFLVERNTVQVGPKNMRLNARRLATDPATGPQVLLAIEDITARRALDEVMCQRIEELAEADRGKDEFLAMLGHELRNPLAPVLFANGILARHLGGDPSLERQCALIDRQVRQLGHLLDDLLEGSRISRGMISLRRTPVDLALLVTNAVTAATLFFEAREQELSYTALLEPLFLHADPVRLEQVVTNLLNNASKYTEPGGTIRVTLEREPDQAVLRVEDNGIGMAPGLLPRIFELFTQGERSLDRSQGGLGIGLALAHNLVALHDGTIEAHSAGVGRGSEFVVRLPLPQDTGRRPGESLLPTNWKPPRSRAVAPAQQRILVVDDNRDSADTLVELAQEWGYAVHAAYDGNSALEVIREFRPRVVLLDLGLPGMDGYEVARQIRRDASMAAVPLVAFTGYGSAKDHLRTSEAGFDHHLTKPVNPEELEKLLATLLLPPAT